jgi:hypothetical protein
MVRQKRQGKMGDQAGKVSETDASRATRLENDGVRQLG